MASTSNSRLFDLEEGRELRLDFGKVQSIGQAVIPVVVQDVESKTILILAYVNREALDYSIRYKIATFWSTSRNELWVKGKTSGDQLELVEIRVNCEQNSLLYLVRLMGKNACHTRRLSCFYRKMDDNTLIHVE